jgi:hypothetical protein
MGADANRIEFNTRIGVDVKGELWSCVEIPDSVEFFGTGRSVRVDATVDEVGLENVGAMVTGRGGHMLSLSAKVRKNLGKEIGDDVRVIVTKRQ